MKHSIVALSLVALLGVAGCGSSFQNTGTWTPMSGDRTAGNGTVIKHTADRAVSHSLHK